MQYLNYLKRIAVFLILCVIGVTLGFFAAVCLAGWINFVIHLPIVAVFTTVLLGYLCSTLRRGGE